MKFKEYMNEANLKDFMNDILYKKVLTAKTRKEYDEAVNVLTSIRGPQALKNLKNVLKKKKK